MAIITDISTAIGQVRFILGDDIDGAGLLPSGANFQDSQIEYVLAATGNVVAAAALRLVMSLKMRWLLLPESFSADGLSVTRGNMLAKLTQLQTDLEAQAQGGSFGTVVLDRQDAYADFWQQSGDDITRGL